MSDKSEPICFVPTGKGAVRGDATPSADGNFMLVSHGEYGDEEPGYRRLPAGWVDAAVERVRKLMSIARYGPVEEFEQALAGVRSALFQPPEPEPWMQEAATTWFRIPAEKRDAAELARHFAKARRERGNP